MTTIKDMYKRAGMGRLGKGVNDFFAEHGVAAVRIGRTKLTVEKVAVKAASKKRGNERLAGLYRVAAEIVAEGEGQRLEHETSCVAIARADADQTLANTAFAAYHWWFGQPRDYWFGRNNVYVALKHRKDDKFFERILEVQANQQARIYALLFMREMARTGELDV